MAKEVWHDLESWGRWGRCGCYFSSLEEALEKVPRWFENGHTKVQITNLDTRQVVALFVLEDDKIERII
jgi:hypothetical protein